MIFDCIRGQFVELKIVDYEFPDIVVDKEDHNWFKDSNWLIIYINVKSKKLCWNATAPVLNIFDVRYIIDWFKDISNNKITEKEIDFIESELSFDLLSNFDSTIKKIKINFMDMFNPSWTNDNLIYRQKYSLKFEATNEELRVYAQNLEQELEKYPER
jgi:hypothetical protein